MLVVIYHYGLVVATLQEHGIGEVPALLEIGNLKTFGAVGVPIFFVISGFVIGLQRFTPGPPAMRDFLVRRVIRLVPLYWALTVVALLVFPPLYGPANILATFGFVHQLLGEPPIIQPGWSLEYEMFFYVAFALLVTSGVFATRSRGILALILLFAALFVGNRIVQFSVFAVYGNPLTFTFALGLLIARIHRQTWVQRFWPINLSAAAALLGASAVEGLSELEMNALWAGGAFFLVLGLASSELLGRPFFAGGLLRRLGDASYSIYLSHTIVVHTLFVQPLWHWQVQRFLEPHVTLLLLAITAAVVGWLTHKLCEAPMTTFLRGLAMRSSEPTDRASGRAFQSPPARVAIGEPAE